MLGIYQLNSATGNFKTISEGTFTEPLSMEVTPTGKSSIQKVWLRNNDLTKYYSDISIAAKAAGGTALNPGLSVKMIVGTDRPKSSDWEGGRSNTIPSGDFISIGDSSQADLQYYPFWVRVTAISALPIGEVRAEFSISYTESVI
jgi:hypothetical protein